MKLAEGQVAVVTGAASGIGLALSKALAGRGLRVVMADINAGRLDEAAAGMPDPASCATFTCDVANREAVAGLRDFALARHGQIDLLFSNAGVVLPFMPMWEYTSDDWRWLMDINLWSVINGIQEFVPYFVKRGSGHLINTASMAGMSVIPGNGAYNAAKHAVVSLSETLAAELREAAPGVRASVLCPGLVPTNIHGSAQLRPNAGPPQDMVAARPAGGWQKNTISAEVLAERTLAAVERDEVYIFPNPGSEERIHARFDGILVVLGQT